MSRCDERLKDRVEESTSRQNKLEIPNDEEEVNPREIHKYDGEAHDPDTMVVPLTPKPTRRKTPPPPETVTMPLTSHVSTHKSQMIDM
jgi:hypothetical protein